MAPSSEKEPRERMRAYEAEKTPDFIPAENEIYEREMRDVGQCEPGAGVNPATVAAIRGAKAGKVTPVRP